MIPFQEPLSVTLPKNPAFLPPLLKMGTSFFENCGGSQERALRMELALEELFIMLSRSPHLSEKSLLEISFRRAPLGVRIIITDRHASPFSAEALQKKEGLSEEDFSEETLGIFLLKKMADLVSLHQQGEEGDIYHLFFSLEESVPPGKPREKKHLIPGDHRVLQVSSLSPEEAEGAASFLQELFPKASRRAPWISSGKIRNLLLSERLIPCTLRNRGGQVFGFSGLFYQEENLQMPRILPPWVHPELPFSEVGGQMIAYLLDQARSRKCPGVTAMLLSEEEEKLDLFTRHGFARCARIPNAFDFTRYAPGKSGDLLCHIFRKDPLPPLFASWEDQKRIEPLLRNAGYTPVFARPQLDISLMGRSVLQITVSPEEERGEIRILHFGVDLFLQTRQALQHLRKLGIPGVLLKLPLGNPQTSLFADKFHEMGFASCGILPNLPEGMEILFYLPFTA
ncbi:MAG TPA: ATP-binding protein [Synergistaceae bacterium]|nr:ATP-binding protein [Synergistaceae bacterium]